jgi:hypothetical protein
MGDTESRYDGHKLHEQSFWVLSPKALQVVGSCLNSSSDFADVVACQPSGDNARRDADFVGQQLNVGAGLRDLTTKSDVGPLRCA